MKNVAFSLLSLAIFTSCNTVKVEPIPRGPQMVFSIEFDDNGEPSSLACIYDDTRDDDPPVILPVENCNGMIGTTPSQFQILENYLLDKVKRLEVCLNAPKKCK